MIFDSIVKGNANACYFNSLFTVMIDPMISIKKEGDWKAVDLNWNDFSGKGRSSHWLDGK